MSENRMIGDLDAKIRRAKDVKLRKKNEWPWSEVRTNADGSVSGIEGYVRVIEPDDGRAPFEIRGTVRWWHHKDTVK